MNVVDKTGQPRSDQDLQEAIDCINTIMIKHALVLPILTVHSGIIRDCLRELQARRAKDHPPTQVLSGAGGIISEEKMGKF